MIAGTLVVCGAAGRLPGYLMRRGTLLLGGDAALPPTFVAIGGEHAGVRRTARAGVGTAQHVAAAVAARPWQRFAGDMATLGRGEILLAGATR